MYFQTQEILVASLGFSARLLPRPGWVGCRMQCKDRGWESSSAGAHSQGKLSLRRHPVHRAVHRDGFLQPSGSLRPRPASEPPPQHSRDKTPCAWGWSLAACPPAGNSHRDAQPGGLALWALARIQRHAATSSPAPVWLLGNTAAGVPRTAVAKGACNPPLSRAALSPGHGGLLRSLLAFPVLVLAEELKGAGQEPPDSTTGDSLPQSWRGACAAPTSSCLP